MVYLAERIIDVRVKHFVLLRPSAKHMLYIQRRESSSRRQLLKLIYNQPMKYSKAVRMFTM